MLASDGFELHPPTQDDLHAAESAWRNGTLCHELEAGDVFWRTLRASTADLALERARECFPSAALNRFSPITLAGKIVPAAYAASTETASLWEVALRNIRHKGIKRVPTREVKDRYLVNTRIARNFQLLDLRRPTISNLVARGKRPPDLTAAWPAAYDTTRAWAQALYERVPAIDGLIYESHQVAGDCIVLFQADEIEVFDTLGVAHALDKDPVRTLLRYEARRAGAVVDFGDLDDE